MLHHANQKLGVFHGCGMYESCLGGVLNNWLAWFLLLWTTLYSTEYSSMNQSYLLHWKTLPLQKSSAAVCKWHICCYQCSICADCLHVQSTAHILTARVVHTFQQHRCESQLCYTEVLCMHLTACMPLVISWHVCVLNWFTYIHSVCMCTCTNAAHM